jgi:hypothetical protein
MVMDRKAFLQKSILAFMSMNTLSSLKAFTDEAVSKRQSLFLFKIVYFFH